MDRFRLVPSSLILFIIFDDRIHAHRDALPYSARETLHDLTPAVAVVSRAR